MDYNNQKNVAEHPRQPIENRLPVLAAPRLSVHLLSEQASGDRLGDGDDVGMADESPSQNVAANISVAPRNTARLDEGSHLQIDYGFEDRSNGNASVPNEGAGSSPSIDNRTDEERMQLIEECLEYTHSCRVNNDNPRMNRRFQVPVTFPVSQLLLVLRNATRNGLAGLIWASPNEECYEVGSRPPPEYDGYPFATIGPPQWWVGKSAAEIKAGPLADDRAIRDAQAVLRHKEKRQVGSENCRNKKGNSVSRSRIENKLEAGLRRQEANLPMCDSDGEDG
ncbi:hypothetical protein CC86DRAFT_386747 [Ophiobolus disseminans]|uniref:Uncharacterized protein n=1 Tax=Ophiobolus disseminans TaxID=1469910 RepID=A0A6A6ZJQ1_9PLEO|nr:hypothetical protein CC86DRAFT_386747 [Ophiobolus disseminans]